MKFSTITLSIIMVFITSSSLLAECPLDHLIVGCNEDGIFGTADDKKLFVERWQKYRHSDPSEENPIDYLNWYYPLYRSDVPPYDWVIGEPGFDAFDNDSNYPNRYAYDPNRCLIGERDVDYRIIIECISITQGFRARYNDYPQFTIDKVGDSFNQSGLPDDHIHLQFKTPDPNGSTELHWITWQMYDEIEDGNQYEPSEPFTMVFVREPLAGDLVVDGTVDMDDVMEFCYYWLEDTGDRSNDYYERADANRGGTVNFLDFALLSSNWLK